MFREILREIDVKCFVIILVLFLGGIIVGLTIVSMSDLWLAALVGVVLTLVSLYKTKQDGGPYWTSLASFLVGFSVAIAFYVGQAILST